MFTVVERFAVILQSDPLHAAAPPLLLLQLLVAVARPLRLLLLLLVVGPRPLLLLLLLLDAAARLLLRINLCDGKSHRCHPGPKSFPRQARHSGTVESVLWSAAWTAATLSLLEVCSAAPLEL